MIEMAASIVYMRQMLKSIKLKKKAIEEVYYLWATLDGICAVSSPRKT